MPLSLSIHRKGLPCPFSPTPPSPQFQPPHQPRHQKFLTGASAARCITYLLLYLSKSMCDQDWLSAPWRNIPKSPFHYLLDIMVEMPSLLEQTEKSFGTINPPSSLTLFGKQSSDFEERLHRWCNNQAS
jgi:hypothetical protein